MVHYLLNNLAKVHLGLLSWNSAGTISLQIPYTHRAAWLYSDEALSFCRHRVALADLLFECEPTKIIGVVCDMLNSLRGSAGTIISVSLMSLGRGHAVGCASD